MRFISIFGPLNCALKLFRDCNEAFSAEFPRRSCFSEAYTDTFPRWFIAVLVECPVADAGAASAPDVIGLVEVSESVVQRARRTFRACSVGLEPCFGAFVHTSIDFQRR